MEMHMGHNNYLTEGHSYRMYAYHAHIHTWQECVLRTMLVVFEGQC